MRLRARASQLAVPDVTAELVFEDGIAFPMLRTNTGLVLSLEAALLTYEVIDASVDERRVLAQSGRPFGGVV